MLEAFGRRLAAFLSKDNHPCSTSPATDQALLKRALRPGDVLLVEGASIIATAVKYLTQSTWSHAALYIGVTDDGKGEPAHSFVEADLLEGVRLVGIEKYAGYNCRICRPVGLSPQDCDRVISCAKGRLGHSYDTRNVIDLARYLLPTPPAPTSWRRRMIAFGSGDPTRAICSGLIAEAYQFVRYPILPDIEVLRAARDDCEGCINEILHVRHHSLFVPRDFDVSPYFEVVKPTLPAGFDFHALNWASDVVVGERPAEVRTVARLESRGSTRTGAGDARIGVLQARPI